MALHKLLYLLFLNKYCTCLYTEKITQPYYIFPLFSMQYTHFFYMLLNNVTIKMTITDYSSGKNTCFRLHILTSCNDWKWKYIWNKQGSRCKCLCILKSIVLLNFVVCRPVQGPRNSWIFKFYLYNMVYNRTIEDIIKWYAIKMCIDITLIRTNSHYFMINNHFYEWLKMELRSKIASFWGLPFLLHFWSSDPSISTYCIAGKTTRKVNFRFIRWKKNSANLTSSE